MDNKEVALVTGAYVAVVVIIAAVMLVGGTYVAERIASWDAGSALLNERAPWEASI